MARKNNCDHLFPLPAKHKPRFWLQTLLLAVMGHIQNPVQSLEKMLLASERALDQGQCEQKPSSAAQLWGNPCLVLSSDPLPVNREYQWLPGSRTVPLTAFLPWLCGCPRWGGDGSLGKMAREELLLSTSLLCLQPLPPGLLSAAAAVAAEHLHRGTSLFPVVDDIIKTAGVWCAHLTFWLKKPTNQKTTKTPNYFILWFRNNLIKADEKI